MTSTTETALVEVLRDRARPLTGAADDYDDLLDLVGDARFVLLGEASHGTHEFYHERAEITRRLIAERGFAAVAVEADWPDAARVNRYVRGLGEDTFGVDALGDFLRFPTWMWRNADVVEFVEWLRGHNDARPPDALRTGWYGLDLYSLRASMEAVLRYLEKVDPPAADRARTRYACFDQYGDNARAYGFLAGTGVSRSCEDEAVRQLAELVRRTMTAVDDDVFEAMENARVVRDAEQYYRQMFVAEVSTWNLRDRHMADTLDALVTHLDRRLDRARVVVWAHNSHLGDARATEMSARGELNLGQLVRERHRGEVVSVGFTTHHGTVTAASEWEAPAERKRVRPALADSYEAAFHETGIERFLLRCRDGEPPDVLRNPALERAIGVIYSPETERASHYFWASLARQFDVVLHFDETRAVEPLERTARWEAGDVPQTYPFAV